jgi:hypothetical protein
MKTKTENMLCAVLGDMKKGPFFHVVRYPANTTRSNQFMTYTPFRQTVEESLADLKTVVKSIQ